MSTSYSPVVGGDGSSRLDPREARQPLLPSLDRPASPRFLQDRFRRPYQLRQYVMPCIGVSFLALFLFLTVNSTLHPPPVGPGRRTALELATGNILSDLQGDSIVWDRLAEMTDLFGPRISGGESLERSIDWMMTMMTQEDNLMVWTEKVQVDVWERNEESLELLLPSRPPVPLPMLGLGGSVATAGGNGSIEAEVLVVQDVEELMKLGNETISGKIVLFDDDNWKHYGDSVKSRVYGAREAERFGAVGVLVRSVTPFSLGVPHAGSMLGANIPAAAITVEDSQYIRRVWERHGKADHSASPFAHLFEIPKGATSRNIIAEIPGRSRPEDIIVLGGHIDSWDVGTGAMDDAAGFFAAWHALRAISHLKEPPLRTIRVVGWVAEERGQFGAKAYAKKHAAEIPHHIFAMESDTGVFQPWGLSVTGSEEAVDYLSAAGQHYLGHIGAGNITSSDSSGADVAPLCQEGVPCASFLSLDPITQESPLDSGLDGYFYYHHTRADTVAALKPKELALASAAMGIWAYLVAEMVQSLPRDDKADA
ncbi:hypothetical protein BJ684DRAFT_15646 [Piptocephalis cylindrospora]|uniref:Peptide hydrolase n=1 Tax=Piptocephalis cylindrospora TaxID=1907219 RepID=A0A4V1IYB7_9FUNG|nr:hypothetical protein BJ684DRAFT_15646 [Piptocephalis cylindrospora]|eukprot:RKP13999.1 hypothetical protein BJ684DRAFT_15646 [Piptocephalis cylindrospora]